MHHSKRYTVTAALPYANGPIHLGHIAGTYLPADIYVRYLRQKKATVVFISGSDEHGVPIIIRAKQEGSTPKKIVDKYHAIIKKSLQELNISFDIFGRTSSLIHYETASEFFKKLHKKGVFKVYEKQQYYDPIYKQFLSDRYIKGNCPKCTNINAYGDQCEVCGSTLSPEELKNPISTISGIKPILKSTKHWYLPLDKYESWLKKWILEKHKVFKNNVYGQCRSWLNQGLQPRSVTRDLSWGIPVPLPEGNGKVLYVWFDAPIAYISATKEWAKIQKIDWRPFWQESDTKLVHFLGKDNIVFHCIIFPVMLKAHGNFILPDQIPANEFLNLEGKKISTSRNYAIWLNDYLEDFPDKIDVLRYVLCTITPENKDSDFTWKDFQNKNNNELVANLGNLVHRTLSLVHKYFGGLVPANIIHNEAGQSLFITLKKSFIEVGSAIEQFKFKEALQLCMGYATLGNKYLTDSALWHLVKKNPDAAGTALYITLQLIATLTQLIKPFLPTTSDKIANMLGIKNTGWEELDITNLVKTGSRLAFPEKLFEKIEDNIIAEQIKKIFSSQKEFL